MRCKAKGSFWGSLGRDSISNDAIAHLGALAPLLYEGAASKGQVRSGQKQVMQSSNKTIVASIDAMGGDAAPDVVIEGLSLAAKRDKRLRFEVFGDQARVEPLVQKFSNLHGICTLNHTDVMVLPDDKPKDAMRSKRANSSMRLAVEAVKAGKADFCASAGSTAALLTVATLVLRKAPGIDRAAIIAPFPTAQKPLAFLDLGANVDVTERNLVQFALMGCIYARIVLGHAQPTVGLLNIGTEEGKGKEVLQTGRVALEQAQLPGEFIGFVEPNHMSDGDTNVVVADGVSGNIALKMSEGIARFVAGQIRKEIKADPISMIGGLLARRAFGRARANIDPNVFNGGMFIGLNGICMKSHGSSEALGWASCVSNGAALARQNVVQQITDCMQSFDEA